MAKIVKMSKKNYNIAIGNYEQDNNVFNKK